MGRLQVPRLKAEAIQRVLQALADAYATGEPQQPHSWTLAFALAALAAVCQCS